MATSTSSYGQPRRLRRLGRWLVALLLLSFLVGVGVVAADVDQLDVFNRLVAGEDVSFEEVTASDDRVGLTVALNLLMFIVTGIVWIVWFRRAYRNIELFGRVPMRFAKGWAVGGWFVPFFNWVRPKQIANDIWRACDPSPPPSLAVEDRPVAPLLNVWWTAWVIVSIGDNFVARRLFESETISDQRNSAVVTLVVDAGWLALTLLAIAVVLKITGRYERKRAETLRSQPATAEPRFAPALSG